MGTFVGRTLWGDGGSCPASRDAPHPRGRDGLRPDLLPALGRPGVPGDGAGRGVARRRRDGAALLRLRPQGPALPAGPSRRPRRALLRGGLDSLLAATVLRGTPPPGTGPPRSRPRSRASCRDPDEAGRP